jgi:hypothetical protein
MQQVQDHQAEGYRSSHLCQSSPQAEAGVRDVRCRLSVVRGGGGKRMDQ